MPDQRPSARQYVLQAATLVAVLFATSRSQSCSTVVQLENLASGLARATPDSCAQWSDKDARATPDSCAQWSDKDVSDIIGCSWNVSDAECVEIQFSPGVYLTTRQGVNVTHNVVLSSIDGNVTIACTGGSNDSSSAPYLYGFSKDQGSVTMVGLSFVNCTSTLKFDNLNNLEIINSTFSNFMASPLDIFNCWHVNITKSSFVSTNSNVTVANKLFRGYSGGISVAYKSVTTNDSLVPPPYLSIASCTFNQNTALYYAFQEANEQQRMINNTYPGRGGGIAILIFEEYYNLTVAIESCTFVGNTASSGGGALYVNLRGGANTSNVITVSNCLFEGNSADTGGGTHVIFNSGFSATQFVATGCTYRNNNASYGGAISSLRLYEVGLKGNRFSLVDTVFEANRGSQAGSAAAFFSYQYPFNPVKPYSYLIRNCTYVNNQSPEGGILLTSFVNLNLEGAISFRNNSGAALMNIGSLITVNGSILFVGNDASSDEGGALYIMEFGQMRMLKGSKMEFVDNKGSIGAAIVVRVQAMSPAFSSLEYNPQCWLIFENKDSSPLSDNNVTVLFQGNSAKVGAAVYISSLESCSWINSTHQTVLTEFPNWNAFKLINNTNTAQVNDSDAVDIQTEAIQLYAVSMNNTMEAEAYPGQLLNLSIIGKDQFNNPTYVVVWLKDSSGTNFTGTIINDADSSNTAKESVLMNPALLPILPYKNTVTTSPFIRQINFTRDSTVSLILSAPYNIQQQVAQKYDFYFNLTIKYCKPGYRLSTNPHSTAYMCVCVNDTKILVCEEQGEGTVILQDGYWAGVADLSISPSQLVFLPCPAGYCNCRIVPQRPNTCSNVYFQADIDKNQQCQATRKGLLCGDCIDELSVGILRPNCRNCTGDNTKPSIATLAFSDVILTLAVLFVSVKYRVAFPASLKGLLFYIQTIYWSTEFIAASCWDIRQYLLYVSSALSLYFPWDFCFYPGAKALEMAAVKFITPAIVTITSVVVFLLFKRWRGQMWNGILILILLLYPSLVHNCASLLHCEYIADGNSYRQYWYQDSSVQCYDDWLHMVLAVVSVVLLPLLGAMIPFIVLVVVYTSIKTQQQEDTRFHNIWKALSVGYRDTTGWWYSIDLLRRYLLLIVLPLFPGKTVIPILVVMTATAAHAFIQPYSVVWHNYVEMALLCFYVALLLFNSTTNILDKFTKNESSSIPITSGLQLSDYDNLTWVFATLFYAPLVLAIIMCFLRFVYICCKWSCKGRGAMLRVPGKAMKSDSDLDTFTLPESRTIVNFDGHVDRL